MNTLSYEKMKNELWMIQSSDLMNMQGSVDEYYALKDAWKAIVRLQFVFEPSHLIFETTLEDKMKRLSEARYCLKRLSVIYLLQRYESKRYKNRCKSLGFNNAMSYSQPTTEFDDDIKMCDRLFVYQRTIAGQFVLKQLINQPTLTSVDEIKRELRSIYEVLQFFKSVIV